MRIIVISAFILSFALTLSAHAARWIVKNPKQMANIESSEIQAQQILNLENQYLILKTSERITANQISQIFQAEDVFEDLKITIDDPTVDENDENIGWHTEALEYDQLNKSYTGQGIIVAVLDTGVDYNHPALEGKMWKNVGEIPNNKKDDDKNGLVDDYHGYNFNDVKADPFDTGSHGTHCAGIIAAQKNKDFKAQGIAQDVKIMPLVIIGGNNEGFLADAASAVKYATDNGAKVLSNSWRIYSDWDQFMNKKGLKLLDEAIEYANKHEVIFVNAAGNENKDLDVTNETNPMYPLAFGNSNIVGVASTSKGQSEEILSAFSNFGIKTVPVAAPGAHIYSTLPFGRWGLMSGTSMATPMVAGAVARGLSKGYNMQEAINQLYQTSQQTPAWQQFIKFGRVDIKKYLE